MNHQFKTLGESVSVIIPAYNAENWLIKSVGSVIEQTRNADEIIIVDDGSTDNTKGIIDDNFGNSVRYIYQENKGLPSARNKGIESSTSTWIALLDADDIWNKEKLEQQMLIIESNPGLDWVSCNYYKEKQSKNALEYANEEALIVDDAIELFLKNSAHILPSVAVLRRDHLEDLGGFDPTFRTAQDIDLWARYAHKYPCFGYCTKPLAVHSYNADSLSHHDAEGRLRRIKSLAEKHSKLARDRRGQNILKYVSMPLCNTLRCTFGLCSTKHHREVISTMKKCGMHVPLYIRALSYVPYPLFKYIRRAYDLFR